MPTDMEYEEPGVFYRHGLRSPITGRPQVIIDMDVVVNSVKSEGDYSDDSFTKQVGEWLAHRLMFRCVEVINHQTGDLNRATKIVMQEVNSRPASERYPYAGALRYAGELLDVILEGTSKSQWLIRDKDGNGFGRFFYQKKTSKPERIPKDIWTYLSFCAHRECIDDGCVCVCHDDGRNVLFEAPLEDFISNTFDDLLHKWTYTIELVTYLLYEEAQLNAEQRDNYLGQVAGIEAAMDWLVPRCYDPVEWMYTGALNVSLIHLLKPWVAF